MPSRRILLKIPCGSSRSVRPQRPIWRTAYGSALSFPNSLCALIRFDFRLDGLSRRTNQRFANYRTSPKRVNNGKRKQAGRRCPENSSETRLRPEGPHMNAREWSARAEDDKTSVVSSSSASSGARIRLGISERLGSRCHVTHMGGWYNVFASEAMPLAFLN